MKVHPMPNLNSKPRNLRRLPHIFSKVLELPFSFDTDVSIHETATSLVFTASTHNADAFDPDSIRAQAIEIFPGVMKVVIKDDVNYDVDDEMELNKWRFRLPDETRPRLASVELINDDLVVQIPKGFGDEDEEEREEFEVGRLVLVR